jgi:hypothetical protein
MIQTVTREFSKLGRPLLGVALSLLATLESGHAQVSTLKATSQPAAAAIRPFKAHVPDRIRNWVGSRPQNWHLFSTCAQEVLNGNHGHNSDLHS